MSRLGHRWDWTKPFKLYQIRDGHCAFPDEHEMALRHQADYFNYISSGNFDIRFTGVLDEMPAWDSIDDNCIYSRFVEPYDADSRYWAWARTKTLYGTQAIGGINTYRKDKLTHPQHFPGMSVHELCHIIGLAHVSYDSIMQNQPYLGYQYQGLLQARDFYNLSSIIPGRLKMIPAVYDYGKLDPTDALIHIPSIEIAPGVFKGVTLWAFRQASGGWEMNIKADETRDVTIRDYTSYIKDDVLHFPLRYRGTSFNVTGDLVKTNSLWQVHNINLEVVT